MSTMRQEASPPVKISVKTLTGQVFLVELQRSPANSVSDIKQRIEASQGIPVSFQRLVYGGRELKDAELFTAVNITDGVTVHLFLRTNQPAAEPEPGQGQGSFPAPMTPIMPLGDPRIVQPPMPGAAAIGNFNMNGGGGGVGVAIDMQQAAAQQRMWPLSQDDIVRLRETHKYSGLIRMLALVDAVLVVIWALQNAYFFLLLLLTICGVYGAHRYNKWCVVGYLVYLCANIVLRIWWMAAKPNVLLIVLLIIGLVFEIFVIWLTIRFAKLCWQLKRDEASVLYIWRARGAAGDDNGF